jgi:hypothetical protein
VDAYLVNDPLNRSRAAGAAVLWAWVGLAGAVPHYEGEPPHTVLYFYDHGKFSRLLVRWAVTPLAGAGWPACVHRGLYVHSPQLAPPC